MEEIGRRVGSEVKRAAARSIEFDVPQLAAFGSTLLTEAVEEIWRHLGATYGSSNGEESFVELPAEGRGSDKEEVSVGASDSDTVLSSASPALTYTSTGAFSTPPSRRFSTSSLSCARSPSSPPSSRRSRATRRQSADTVGSLSPPSSAPALSATAAAPRPDGSATPSLVSIRSVAFDCSEATERSRHLARALRAVIAIGEAPTVTVEVLGANEAIFTPGQCGIAAVLTAIQEFSFSPREARAMLTAQLSTSDMYDDSLQSHLAALLADDRTEGMSRDEIDECIVRAEVAAVNTVTELQHCVAAEDLEPGSVLQLLAMMGRDVVYVLNRQHSGEAARPLVLALSTASQGRTTRSKTSSTPLDRVVQAACHLDRTVWRSNIVLSGLVTLEHGHYWAFVNHPSVTQAWLCIDTMLRKGNARVTLVSPADLAARVTGADAIFIMGNGLCGRTVQRMRPRSTSSGNAELAREPVERPPLASQVSEVVDKAAASATHAEARESEREGVGESEYGRESEGSGLSESE